MRIAVPLLLLAPLVCAAEAAKPELSPSIFAYEPTYFALDPGWRGRNVNAKFQFSMAFRIIGADGFADPGQLRPDGLFAAYSQTSFWDLEGKSKPFYDSSYRPETWWHLTLPGIGIADRFGLEPGLGHESNGKAGADSRSINHAFLRTQAAWKLDGWQILAEPRVRTYLDKEDNPDIQRYRGYADLELSVNKVDSWGLATVGRIGSESDRGSMLVELTHPMGPWTNGEIHGFLYIQAFFGWSETLLSYDQRAEQPRVLFGFAITR